MVSSPWVRIKSTDYFCYCKVLVFLQAFTFRCSLIRKKPDWKRMDVKPKSTNPLVCQLLSTIYFVRAHWWSIFLYSICVSAEQLFLHRGSPVSLWTSLSTRLLITHSFHTTVETMWSIDLRGKWADSDIELFYPPQSTLYNRPHSHPLKQTLFNTGIACLYCLTSLLLK